MYYSFFLTHLFLICLDIISQQTDAQFSIFNPTRSFFLRRLFFDKDHHHSDHHRDTYVICPKCKKCRKRKRKKVIKYIKPKIKYVPIYIEIDKDQYIDHNSYNAYDSKHSTNDEYDNYMTNSYDNEKVDYDIQPVATTVLKTNVQNPQIHNSYQRYVKPTNITYYFSTTTTQMPIDLNSYLFDMTSNESKITDYNDNNYDRIGSKGTTNTNRDEINKENMEKAVKIAKMLEMLDNIR